MRFNLNPDNIECIADTTMDMAYLDKVLGDGRRIVVSHEHSDKTSKIIREQFQEASGKVKTYAIKMKTGSKTDCDARDAVAMLKALSWLDTWSRTHVCQPIPKLGQSAPKATKKKKA